jgi:uncharacterized protein
MRAVRRKHDPRANFEEANAMEITSYTPGTPCWVDLGSPDPAATSNFYAQLFGWTVEDMGPDSGGYRMCSLRGKPVAGLGPQTRDDVPPYWTTYISVSDADVAANAVRKAGGQVFMEPMDVMDAGRMAVFADTTGAAFSVWQPNRHIGAGLINETGTVCWNELNTRHVEQAKEFYRDVFGWNAVSQPMGESTYVEWKVDDRTVGGMMPMDQRWPADAPSHWLPYFAVDDTDAAVAKVSELGGTVHVAPTDIPPGRFSVVSDPYGAVFSLIRLNPM